MIVDRPMHGQSSNNLVSTMIEYIDTPGAISRIQHIIDEARQRLVLVSPFLQIAPNILGRLSNAERKGVGIGIVYGKEEELSPEVEKALKRLKKLSLRYYKDLHAKCYFNEEAMVITSMNLYEYSQRNLEMGVFVTCDEEVYQKAAHDVDLMIANSISKPVTPVAKAVGRVKKAIVAAAAEFNEPGSCIRCGDPIAYDPNFPLCGRCFASWNMYRNPDHREKYCHDCGRKAKTSYALPRCKPCWKASP